MEESNKLHNLIQPGEKIAGDWYDRPLPENISIGKNSIIDSSVVFKQFFSKQPLGLVLGDHSTIFGASIATEENAIIEIGDYSFISNASIACNSRITIGNYVFIAGGVNIVDTDFHPLDPATRLADTIALSPAGNRNLRPVFSSAAVVIEDEVWIGYNATILKGVRIGKGSIIQPGTVIVKDVPAGKIVAGNPATIIQDI
jgi:acetyltransferase-like isoleucine patch superfamily enzyme